MRVSILVILCCGTERITLHEDDDQAWSELVHFVDESWDAHPGTTGTPQPGSEDERVERFFAAQNASFILGNADVSDLEEYAAAVIRE